MKIENYNNLDSEANSINVITLVTNNPFFYAFVNVI